MSIYRFAPTSVFNPLPPMYCQPTLLNRALHLLFSEFRNGSPPPPRVFIIFIFRYIFNRDFFLFFLERPGVNTPFFLIKRRSMEGALNGWLASLFVRNLLLGGLDNLYNGTVVLFSYFLLDFFHAMLD